MEERLHDPSREIPRALLEEVSRGIKPDSRTLDYSVFKRAAFLLLGFLAKRDSRRDYPLQYILICSKRV